MDITLLKEATIICLKAKFKPGSRFVNVIQLKKRWKYVRAKKKIQSQMTMDWPGICYLGNQYVLIFFKNGSGSWQQNTKQKDENTKIKEKLDILIF